MNLDLPTDARVQIFIAPGGHFSTFEDVPVPVAHPQAQPPARPKRLLLKSAAAVLLVGGGYILGGASARHEASIQAQAEAYASPASAQSAASGVRGPVEVPQAFAQKLKQPATVTPPPGAPSPGTPARNAFGLED